MCIIFEWKFLFLVNGPQGERDECVQFCAIFIGTRDDFFSPRHKSLRICVSEGRKLFIHSQFRCCFGEFRTWNNISLFSGTTILATHFLECSKFFYVFIFSRIIVIHKNGFCNEKKNNLFFDQIVWDILYWILNSPNVLVKLTTTLKLLICNTCMFVDVHMWSIVYTLRCECCTNVKYQQQM